MTTRSHETIRVGLRRIIRDPGVRPKMRMDAIAMLMRVEGLMEQAGSPKKKPAITPISEANAKRLRELIAAEEEKKTG